MLLSDKSSFTFPWQNTPLGDASMLMLSHAVWDGVLHCPLNTPTHIFDPGMAWALYSDLNKLRRGCVGLSLSQVNDVINETVVLWMEAGVLAFKHLLSWLSLERPSWTASRSMRGQRSFNPPIMTEVEPIIVWLTMPAGGLQRIRLKEGDMAFAVWNEEEGVSETLGEKLIYF